MDPLRVIVGPVVTEKAERLKATERSYTIRISPRATKVDVQRSLETLFDVEVASVRIMHVGAKSRSLPTGAMMEKRHAWKKAVVTLTPASKALDLSSYEPSAA